MPTPTYVALAKTVLTGSQTDVTFSSIPSTYTDLVLLCSTRDNQGAGLYRGFWVITVNGNTSNYGWTRLTGNSSAASSSRQTSGGDWYGSSQGGGSTSNTFGSYEFYFANYGSSANKVMSSTGTVEGNTSTANQAYIEAQANLWADTTAINTIKIATSAGQFVSGSRFDLYGVKNS